MEIMEGFFSLLKEATPQGRHPLVDFPQQFLKLFWGENWGKCLFLIQMATLDVKMLPFLFQLQGMPFVRQQNSTCNCRVNMIQPPVSLMRGTLTKRQILKVR